MATAGRKEGTAVQRFITRTVAAIAISMAIFAAIAVAVAASTGGSDDAGAAPAWPQAVKAAPQTAEVPPSGK
jgi:hypothetical protein